jgi:hypothetical protein
MPISVVARVLFQHLEFFLCSWSEFFCGKGAVFLHLFFCLAAVLPKSRIRVELLIMNRNHHTATLFDMIWGVRLIVWQERVLVSIFGFIYDSDLTECRTFSMTV